MVLADLRNDIFPRRESKILKIKKIEPFMILTKFSKNTYELELPTGRGILPIFNVVDLYPY